MAGSDACEPTSPSIFISYRRSQAAAVDVAADALEKAGLRTWVDRQAIEALADFPERIRDGIANSHAALIWWSADYAESDICLQEFKLAWQHARRHNSNLARRIWVLNLEPGGQHIFAGELNAKNFLKPPAPGYEAAWAQDLATLAKALLPEGTLGDERDNEPLPTLNLAPMPRRDFTGRGVELWRIHSLLHPPQVTARGAAVAVQIHGMGGIGKTELAAAYANEFARAYPGGVVWLNLASWSAEQSEPGDAEKAWRRALDQAFSKDQPGWWRDLSHDAEGAGFDAPLVRERLARHFGQAQQPYLWVLDNFPALDRLDEVRDEILKFCSAPSPNGRTLITTRDSYPLGNSSLLRLEEMADDVALRLLARFRPKDASEIELTAMTELIKETGAYTQALVLLGSFARNMNVGYPKVLERLREEGRLPRIETISRQLRSPPFFLGRGATGIVATFALSVADFDANTKELLALATACAPNTPIPVNLLQTAFGGNSREDDFGVARFILERASLLMNRDAQKATVSIHPLVADATSRLLEFDQSQAQEAIASALLVLLAPLEDDALQEAGGRQSPNYSPEEQLTALLPHARVAGAYGDGIRFRRLFRLVGRFDTEAGDYWLACDDYVRWINACTDHLNEADPERLLSGIEFVEALLNYGKPEEASEWGKYVVEIAVNVHGPTDELSIRAKEAYAKACLALNDASTALALYQEIATHRQSVESSVESRLAAVDNLASTLHRMGDLDAAYACYEETFKLRQRRLGSDDPQTLASELNVASILVESNEANRLQQAQEYQQHVVLARSRILDEAHPKTLEAEIWLAKTLSLLGKTDAALEIYDRVMIKGEERLPPDHPIMAEAKENRMNTLKRTQ